MRKLILMVICLFTLCFSGCEDTLPTYMGLTTNKLDVKVGEEIDVKGFLHLVILNNQPRYIVLFNGYPSNYRIVEGTLYENWTTKDVLCVLPSKTKGTNNGTVFIKFIFDKPGEYVMTANLCSIDDPKFENEGTDDYYEFTITVTE